MRIERLIRLEKISKPFAELSKFCKVRRSANLWVSARLSHFSLLFKVTDQSSLCLSLTSSKLQKVKGRSPGNPKYHGQNSTCEEPANLWCPSHEESRSSDTTGGINSPTAENELSVSISSPSVPSTPQSDVTPECGSSSGMSANGIPATDWLKHFKNADFGPEYDFRPRNKKPHYGAQGDGGPKSRKRKVSDMKQVQCLIRSKGRVFSCTVRFLTMRTLRCNIIIVFIYANKPLTVGPLGVPGSL